jgi:trehalose 6-phosphate phosphatase
LKHIMARANREILRQFAWSNVLLAFDFDGTLAPIVNDPSRAALRTRTRALLAELSRLYTISVISSRPWPNLRDRLRGVQVIEAMGGHDATASTGTALLRDQVGRWMPVLRRRLAGFKGVVIEDKVLAVAVHYRESREKRRAASAIRKLADELSIGRVIPGKLVFNLLPEGAPHKGLALQQTRAHAGCDTAIYVGDDGTDEDVFSLDEPGRLLALRVGESRRSQAAYFIRNQREIDALLDLLRSCRAGGRSSREARRAA